MLMVTLIGPMGAGKSTIGRRLAARLAVPCVDLDAEIVKQAGKPIPRIFEEEGECAFRALEGALLHDFCTDGAPKVLATGGGVVLSAPNRQRLQESGLVIWLNAPPEVLARRIGGDANRPLLRGVNPLAKAKELDRQRRPLYEACADMRVDTSSMGVGRAMYEILEFVSKHQ